MTTYMAAGSTDKIVVAQEHATENKKKVNIQRLEMTNNIHS